MKKIDIETISTDDLWVLHEEITRVLSRRITFEKRELEKRLASLGRGKAAVEDTAGLNLSAAEDRPRRKYPRVHPKYRNPSMPSQTWAGRGKQPRWLVAALKSGRKIEEFKIKK